MTHVAVQSDLHEPSLQVAMSHVEQHRGLGTVGKALKRMGMGMGMGRVNGV